MKKLVMLALAAVWMLTSCTTLGLPTVSPADPPAVTQDPAVDTAIAKLAGTQIAATKTAAGVLVLPTSPADATAVPMEVATSTSAPTETAPQPSIETVAAATAIPTQANPTPTISLGLSENTPLPAPLLYLALNNEFKQIWRLETDGETTRPVTNETVDVTDFDVSPTDGRLAFVAGNDLFIANPDGTDRTLLVDGVEPLPENDPNRTTFDITRVRWSPDGSKIAYGLGGVNIVSATAGGASLQIIKSDPVPQPPDFNAAGPVYFYWPESWSPDGAHLLISYAIWPEAGGLAVIDAAGGTPLMIKPVESYPCCNPVWTRDGAGIIYASRYFGMILAGMWRSDATTGLSQTLIPGDPGNGTYYLPAFAHQAIDGKLYFFYSTTKEFPEGDVPLAPVSSDGADLSNPTPLRGDLWLVAEALWSPDGRGVVILDQSTATNSEFPLMGKLVYLKSDNSPPLTLPATGGMLRWGR